MSPQPTEIYEDNKLKFQLICFTFVILALCQQWVMPLVRNSLEPFSEMDIGRCVERILKLAIPNHIIWLMIFYTLFHSSLNLNAEITRFADREFYRLERIKTRRSIKNFSIFHLKFFMIYRLIKKFSIFLHPFFLSLISGSSIAFLMCSFASLYKQQRILKNFPIPNLYILAKTPSKNYIGAGDMALKIWM